MAVETGNNSRLFFADLLTLDGFEFWDTVVLPDARPRTDDIQHVVSSTDRIDLLAHRYYGDPQLWWVIAWANNLEILPTDMKQNAQLRIPSKNYVESELLRSVRRRV